MKFFVFLLLLLIASCGSKIEVDDIKNKYKIEALDIEYSATTSLEVNTFLTLPLSISIPSTSVTVSTPPTNGTLTKNADNNWTYTPNPNYYGSESFVLVGSNGGKSKELTVNLNIVNNNIPPVTTDGSVTSNKNNNINIDLSTLTTDSESDTLTYTIVTGPSNGSISSFDTNTGAFIFTPNANFNGSDTISFKSNDALGESNTSVFTINVTNNNNIPTSTNSSVTTDEDVLANGVLSASDLDAETLTYSTTKSPDNGIFSLNTSSGSYTYTPNANFNGTDTIKFRVYDGIDYSPEYTVSYTVTAVNDLPVPADNTYTFNEDVAQAVTLSGSGTDAESDTLTFEIVTGVSKGVVSNFNSNNGTLTYTPNSNFNGTDSFTYRISDGTGTTSTKTITLNVSAVNDSPVYSNVSTSTDEDTVLSATYGASDADLDTLTYSIQTSPTNGALSSFNSSTGYVSYTPNANFNGMDSFSLSVNDGTDTSTMTVSITVNPVDDVFALNDQSFTFSVNGTHDTTMSLSTADVDGDVVYSVSKSPDHGAISAFNSSTGAYTYTPTASYVGSDTIEITGNDGTTTDISVISYTVEAEASPKIYIISGEINLEQMDIYSMDKDFNTTLVKTFTQTSDMSVKNFNFRENYIYYYNEGNDRTYRYDILLDTTTSITGGSTRSISVSDDIVRTPAYVLDFGDLSKATRTLETTISVQSFHKSFFGDDIFYFREKFGPTNYSIAYMNPTTLDFDSKVQDYGSSDYYSSSDLTSKYELRLGNHAGKAFGNYLYTINTSNYSLMQCDSSSCSTLVTGSGLGSRVINSNYNDKIFFELCKTSETPSGRIYSADLNGNFNLEYSFDNQCEMGQSMGSFVTKDYYGYAGINSGDECPKIYLYNKSDNLLNKTFVLSGMACTSNYMSTQGNITVIQDSNSFLWAHENSGKTFKIDVINETATDLNIPYRNSLIVNTLQ